VKREEFTSSIKLARWEHCKGICEICKLKILGGADYDHDIPWYLTRDSTFENCRCVCKPCHRRKTSLDDLPTIAKTKRIERKAKGVTITQRRKLQSRNTFKPSKSNTVDVKDDRS
jgi:5-methylcytosine-specific restriction protein A